MKLTVGQLINALSDLDTNLPVLLAQQDGEDLPLSEIIPVPGRSVVLYYLEEPINQFPSLRFWIEVSEVEPPQWIIYHNANDTTDKRGMSVGPNTYDYLVAESVLGVLQEEASEFIEALRAGTHHEYVEDIFNRFGGA